MSEDKTTGATDSTLKTYTEPEVKVLVDRAVKEGQTASFRQWQSIADKQLAVIRTQSKAEVDKAVKEVLRLKREQLDKLPPEEQQKVMLAEVYKKMTEGEQAPAQAPPSGEKTEPAPSDAESANADAVAAAREQINVVLKDLGLDPAKVDWADGITGPEAVKRFIKSLVTAKAEPNPDEAEANRTDVSKGAGASTGDLKTLDPTKLIVEGGNIRVRGRS